MIFGTESDSDVELSDESNVQDPISAGSAVGSGKKRAAPEKSLRARLNLAKKMEAMKYFGENPGMTYPKLIERCYKKIDMKTRQWCRQGFRKSQTKHVSGNSVGTDGLPPVPKAYRKCCVKFRSTPTLRSGLILV